MFFALEKSEYFELIKPSTGVARTVPGTITLITVEFRPSAKLVKYLILNIFLTNDSPSLRNQHFLKFLNYFQSTVYCYQLMRCPFFDRSGSISIDSTSPCPCIICHLLVTGHCFLHYNAYFNKACCDLYR